MSDSYEYKKVKTSDKWEKLEIYLYIRSLCGWADVGAHAIDWFQYIMDYWYYVSIDVWGDTGGNFEHITVEVHKGKYIESGPKRGMRYRRQIKFYIAAHLHNRNEKLLAYVQQMCRNHGENIYELRDRYFSHNDGSKVHDDWINVSNRRGPLVGKYHELIGNVFNCDLTNIDLSPICEEGSHPLSSVGNFHRPTAEVVVDNMDDWRALLVAWAIMIHYSMDMSC